MLVPTIKCPFHHSFKVVDVYTFFQKLFAMVANIELLANSMFIFVYKWVSCQVYIRPRYTYFQRILGYLIPFFLKSRFRYILPYDLRWYTYDWALLLLKRHKSRLKLVTILTLSVDLWALGFRKFLKLYPPFLKIESVDTYIKLIVYVYFILKTYREFRYS